MSTVFEDVQQRELNQQDEAQQIRARFKVVRSVVTGDETATDEDRKSAELAEVLALGTDAANFVIADLAACPSARAFVDAVMGATGGNDEFVYVTDKQLSDRIGKSTKTLQNYRNEFRAIKNHSALIEVKDNYQTPEGESFPHRYKCKLTALAVEAMQNAQLSPGWSGDAEAKMRAMKQSAEIVARGASFGALTPPKKRRKPTDAEVVESKLKAAAKGLEDAARRRPMVRNPDFEQLWELRQAVLASLEAFDQAYDFAPPTSIQDQEEEGGSTDAERTPDSSGFSHRMESEKERGVEKTSTRNDSTESTTYGIAEIPQMPENSPPGDSPTSLYLEDCQRIFDEELANGATETEARAAARRKPFVEWQREREEIFDRAFACLKGGRRDE
jgi:guanylate kinase